MDDFLRALNIVLQFEGGYSDDPRDSGGKTMHGVTESVARDFGYMGRMQDLPKDIAAQIYKKNYWDACKCGEMPYPLSLYVFDAAVNQGTGAAKKMLQAALGVKQDGLIGSVTIGAIRKASSELGALFLTHRAMRYYGTRGFDIFGRGWLKRIFLLAEVAK